MQLITKVIALTLMLVFANIDLAKGQSVVFYESAEVQRVMDQYAAHNRLRELIPGYRIQLLSTTDRRKMENIKQKFAANFPYMQTDFQHTPPYYKLRTGAFASKVDAMRILHKVKKEIPGAYITKADIRSTELIN